MAVFSSASIQKCHDGTKGLSGYDSEQTRVMGQGQEEWQNRNIDKGHTHAIELVYNRAAESDRPGAVRDSVMARIREAQGDKTIRKDAVLCLQFFATMPDYSRRSAAERERFEGLVRDFLGTLYGAENVVDMRWHFDETAPHVHATVVPITADGRLCCKEVFRPTKKRQEKWQRDYYEAVAKPMGYDAPDFGHANEKGYTKSTAANRKQAKAMEERRDAAVKAAAEAQERQAIAEGLATEQLDAFVKASSKAAEAERERDALHGEVAALHGERRQAVEAAQAARAAQADAEQAANSAREAADRAAVELAETKAAAGAEAERLESVRREGKAVDGRVSELEAAIAAERLRVEVESDLAFCIEESGGGRRAAVDAISKQVERCREAGERAEQRACELEREAAESRMALGELDGRIDELRPAVERANREVERIVGARAAEIGSAGEELRGRCGAARARFIALLAQARERIEEGLTTVTERLYQSARRALYLVHGYEPDARMADGLTSAYKAADAVVKPAQMPQARAYRQQVARALKSYEKAAKAAKGTPWHRFPKPALPAVPALVGSARNDALRARGDAQARADALRRQYASGRSTGGHDAGTHFEPSRREREQSRSRSR